jgi:hypothetical protein
MLFGLRARSNTMPQPNHRVAIAVSILLCSALSAQQAPSNLQVYPIPIHTAPADPVGGEYGIWAVGKDYKVSFHAGMAFVPYLGAEYPRTQQLGWHTTAVGRGETLLVDERSESTRWHDDFRFEYRFAGMTEAYDVRREGLEQTFVFPAMPRGSGDLWVRGEFLTDLAGTPAGDGSVAFHDGDGRDLIRYGAATVLDAAGRSLRIATGLQGRTATLRVPADWLAEAAFPIATWNMPIPSFMPAFTMYCQDWVLDPSTNLLRSTRRLVVPIAK